MSENVLIRHSFETMLKPLIAMGGRRVVPKAKLAKLFDLNLMHQLNMEKHHALEIHY